MSIVKNILAAGIVAFVAATETPVATEIYSPGAYFESRTILIPNDLKIHRGGEDSAHVCDTLIAVADGVGGWETSGVNPGIFSKKFTRSIRDFHL